MAKVGLLFIHEFELQLMENVNLNFAAIHYYLPSLNRLQ